MAAYGLPRPAGAGLGPVAGHDIRDAGALDGDLTLAADVAIVGTGAGGGVAAEVLSAAGL